MENEKRCGTCRHFRNGKGGAGYRALVQAMIAGNGRYTPSTSDVALVSATDKDGQCTFMPDGVAKYKSEVCGQWGSK
jgi:hypothetical protein